MNSPRSIRNVIDDETVQLKSELDLLLQFNENLLHFDSSIVKKAAKTKVEDFMKTLSAVIDTQSQSGDKISRESRMENLEAASKILSITADISRTLASTLSVGSMTSIQLANISMLVMKKQMGENTTTDWLAGNIKVTLPDQPSIAQDDSSVTVSFTSYHNLGYMMNVEDDIRSPVLSVNVIKTKNHKKSIPLTKPVEFLLHHKPIKKVFQRKCVYWDFKTSSWSRDGCSAIRKKSTSTTTLCQCYHLTNFALSVEQEDAEATTEAATVASKHSWDTLAYFSAEPSVTPEPGYVEEIVIKAEHNVITATKKVSNDFKYFIVSAPPRILKLESLLKKLNKKETIPESKTNKSVFIEFAEQKVKTFESYNPEEEELPVSNYEDFWASNELDETINLGRRDNDSEDMWEKIEDIDNNNLAETLAIETIEALHTIDVSKKSQPLTILKTKERVFNTTSTTKVMKGNVNEVNPLLSTDSLAVGSISIGCSLLVLCLCVCWSQQRRKMGKLSLVGGCSSIAGFDGSVGSVSSLRSLYSQDLSDSFDSISGDQFRSSLEDEM